MTDKTYIYKWGNNKNDVGRERLKYKGRKCKLVSVGKMNSVMVRFIDNNEELVTSRNAIRISR